MCIFCAAIPLAASVGAAANSKQKRQIHFAEEQGTPPPRVTLTAGRATAIIVSGLVVCSIIYHTHLTLPY